MYPNEKMYNAFVNTVLIRVFGAHMKIDISVKFKCRFT